MLQQARKSRRVALFSENEKLFLESSKSFDRKQKHEFFKNLDQRFDELLKKLELMKRSKSLKSWKSFRAWRYHGWFNLDMIRQAFDNTQRIYVERLKHYTEGKGKNKRHFFWLDIKPLKDNRIDDRAFNSEFLFRGLRNLKDNDEWMKTNGELILQVYEKNLLPTLEKNAITIRDIQNILKGKTKPKKEEPKQSQSKFLKEFAKDPRNKEIKKITDRHFKKMNKLLAKYDSKIIQLLPDYH